METIKLYQWPAVEGLESASPFCNKIHYAMRYKRVPYETITVTDFAEAARINSRGKLPVMVYGKSTIADSTDIIRFVETRHPEHPLYPSDGRARALALLLEDWADESLYWHLVYERWQVETQYRRYAAQLFAGAPAEVVEEARKMVVGQLNGQGFGRLTPGEHRESLAAQLGWLEHLINGPFLCGSELSVADISVAAQVDGLANPLSPWAKAEIEKRSALSGWRERVKSAVS